MCRVSRGLAWHVSCWGFTSMNPPNATVGLVSGDAMTAGSRDAILIVDDERAILQMSARILGREFSVTAVSDPREALRLLTQSQAQFALVLCDVSMPHMSGAELLRQLEAARPDLVERIVFMTGGLTDEQERQLGSFNNEYLEKPFDPDQLREVARRRVRSIAPRS